MKKNETLSITIGKNWLNKLFATTLMIVVLLVVISTATFAWYNVAHVVSIDDLTFSSSAQDEAGGELCISWDVLTESEYQYDLPIAPIEEGKGLQPMIPKYLGTVGSSNFDDVSGVNSFNKATQELNDGGFWAVKLETNPNTTPYSLLEKDGDRNTFYLTNKSTVDMKITVTYAITAETYVAPGTNVSVEYPIANKVRLAIFTSDGPTGELILRGYGAKDENQKIHYGILQNHQLNDNMAYDVRTESITFVVPALSYIQAKVVVWFDGVDMQDEDGSKKITLDINYLGETIAPEEPEDNAPQTPEEEGGNE